MKTVLFIPGLFVSHSPYEMIELPEFAKEHGIDLWIHRRQRGIDLRQRAELVYHRLLEIIPARGLDESDEQYASRLPHVLAHSAGGPDLVDCLFHHPEIALKIRSITTIGSPHAGSLIADNFLELKDKCPVYEQLFGLIPVAEKVVYELSTKGRKEYLETHKLPHSTMKKFYCYPHTVSSKWKCVSVSWKGYDIHKKAGLESDCTVSLGSQIFGEVIEHCEAEHKAQTIPLRYGLPFMTVWQKTFERYFKFLNRNFL